MPEMANVEPVYKKSVAIGWALFADLLIFVAIVEFIRIGFSPFEGFSDIQNVQPLRYIFYGLGLAQFFLIPKLSDIPLKKRPIEGIEAGLNRLRISTLIRYGIIEGVGLLGVLLFLISGLYLDFYVFLAISMFYLALFYPRINDWKEWLNC